ncbi:MAG: thioredoxin family protein [Bacteroidetes bacterium]|mgnify:CR=1 FL=1|nr:thioredoxin family protein [Bacteroidota bacterium]
MRKFSLFLICLFVVQIVSAQDTKPVQFHFSAKFINDSICQLQIDAKVEKGNSLFSAIKQNPDDAFISQLILDSSIVSSYHENESPIEKGKMEVIKDSAMGADLRMYADSVTYLYNLHIPITDSSNIKGSFSWLARNDSSFPSGQENFSVKPISSLESVQAAGKTASSSTPLGSIFLVCFAAGLLAVITPCVFPLVPVTVSFFLKKSKSRAEGLRNALTYSISIILIYTIPAIILTLIFGDKILYTISTSAISNLVFFLIFMLFAISFFGAFELQLPNSWANKADSKAGKGGFTGIFFMALTLVIVSFSCTGPIVGTLLGQTSSQGIALAPILGMFAFGLGLALPFSLFAFFPSMIHSLPKSGGWLNSVKVCFGFIELALGLKFLSNVDLIYHWRLLDREIFLVLWIVIAFLMGLYLLGKIKFSHDSPLAFLSVPRLFMAIATFSFGLYLLPGLWGAPLKALSGLLPPITTQDFNLDALQYKFTSNPISLDQSKGNAIAPKRLTEKLSVPFGLTAYFDLNEGMAAAKALNKPVMLDFTGHSCANCRKMEQQVWQDPEVLKRIRENFVLISLYVDESQELPENEKYTNARNEKINTEGEKNLDYEISKFGFNAQPLYMFLDLNGKPLSDVKYGYDPDIAKFIQHLDTVKSAFEKE